MIKSICHHHSHADLHAAEKLIPFIRAAATVGFAIAPVSLGFVIIAVSEQIIRSIMVGDDPEMLVSELQNQFPHAAIEAADHAETLVSEVVVSLESAPSVQESTLDKILHVINLSRSNAKAGSDRTAGDARAPGARSFPSIAAAFGRSPKAPSAPNSTR